MKEVEIFKHSRGLAHRNFVVTLATLSEFAEVIVAHKFELSCSQVQIGKH